MDSSLASIIGVFGRCPDDRSVPNIATVMLNRLFVKKILPSRLYRFTKRSFADAFLERGVISFGCAKSYSDELLTDAQRDIETMRSAKFSSNDTTIRTGPNFAEAQVVPFSTAEMTISIPIYFLLSFATSFDETFYEKFKSDTCIVIESPNEFIRRIDSVFDSQAFPHSSFSHGLALYFDENQPVPPDIGEHPHFLKKECFSWQNEYRVVYLTPPCYKIEKSDKREEFLVGCLSDIARMI